MTILITGGCGLIFSHVARILISEGRGVRIFDRDVRSKFVPSHPSLEVIEGDITDRVAVAAAMEGVTEVYHGAGRSTILESMKVPHEYLLANVLGTSVVLEEARRVGAGFLYAGSASCYGDRAACPIREDAPIDCRYPYAETKHLGERLVFQYAQAFGMHALSVRFFNVYGRGYRLGKNGPAFSTWLPQIRAGRPVTRVGGGDQTRDFVHVTDAARAAVMAMQRGRPGRAYNIGSGRGTSINEILGLLKPAGIVDLPPRPGEPDRIHADISRARDELGWEPRVTIAEGVNELLTHLEDFEGAPVWSAEDCAEASREWMRNLG